MPRVGPGGLGQKEDKELNSPRLPLAKSALPMPRPANGWNRCWSRDAISSTDEVTPDDDVFGAQCNVINCGESLF